MCIILFGLKVHPRYPIVVAANRDEFYDRPSAPAAFWEDHPQLLAGRDLKDGGTWLGTTRRGRLAFLTNSRNPNSFMVSAPSRGKIALNYLVDAQSPQDYLHNLAAGNALYNGFNIVAGDISGLYHYSNVSGQTNSIPPGIHGLCNHLLDTPWPKVAKGKTALYDHLRNAKEPDLEKLLSIMRDNTRASDEELPDTGVGLAMERMLSPIFVESSNYGTRVTTILLIDSKNRVTFLEATYDSENPEGFRRKYSFEIEFAGSTDNG